ncbi:MAG: 5-bromo-4-chloroindolyl phosphate hydrolysis family protein [Halocynthiibacter sp.]
MSKRYGGKYSPDTPTALDGRNRTRVGARANLLFFAPLPIALRAFTSPGDALIGGLSAFVLLILAAFLTREGLYAEEAYDARKIARRPLLPRKILATFATGVGVAIAGTTFTGNMGAAIIMGLFASAFHFIAFGPDPLSNKGMEHVDEFQADRVARAVEKAETYLSEMIEASKRVGDRGLHTQVESFQMTVRHMLRTIENDPRDLTTARKFISVYLLGARDATVKFAEIYNRNRDTSAKNKYEDLLTDLQTNFAQKTEKMLSDDQTDLTVEIEVLKDRLAREGVRL